MPTDWGTTIVDAGGAFHDLTKNAFDSLSNSVRQPLNATETILKESFSKTWGAFREKTSAEFGINLEEGLSLEAIGQKLATGMARDAVEFGVEAIGGAVLSKFAGVEGPIGILMSEVVTIGIAEFGKRFFRQTYEPGQWMILDQGMIPVRVNQAPHVIQVTEGVSIWGDNFLDVPDDIDYAETPHHAVGFIMGPGDTHQEWWIFNFESGREERWDEDKIRPAPPDLAKKLDENSEFSLVREVKFLKDHDPTLKSYVPTQPGEAVIYQNKHYTIVDTFDDEYIIENTKSGERVHVNVSQLSGGIRSNSSTWKRGNLVDQSFTSLSPDTIFSGQWVWIPAGRMFVEAIETYTSRRRMGAVADVKPDQDIFALVEFIDGDQVHLVRAFDGEKITEPLDLTRGVKAEVAEVLNHNKNSKKYKQDVLAGKNTEDHPLGETLHDLALGIGAPDLTKADDMAPLMKVATAGFRHDPTAHTIPADGNALNALKRDIQDKIDDRMNWNATDRTQIIMERLVDDGPSEGNGTAMILLAGVVIFLALYSK